MAKKTCPVDNIMDSWRLCRNSPWIPDLMTSMSKIEENHVQVAFKTVIETIVSNLRYRHVLIEKTRVSRSELKPDIIISKKGTTHPGFQDVLGLVELKSPTIQLQDATVQVSKYLSEHSIFRMSKHLSLNTLIAIATNYKEICIFGFPQVGPVTDLYLYKVAECFPMGWKNMEKPTEGFIELCHAIHQTGNSESRYIQINRSDVVITGTIYEAEGIGVYHCDYQNQDLAIKQGIGKRGKGLVELELDKLRVVSRIIDFDPYLLPWRKDLQVQHGYAMHVGTVISDPRFHQVNNFLEDQYLWMIQGLRILHSHDLYHMDIRPGNIVIYKNKGRLIDWWTLQRGEIEHAYLRQGHEDPFWPFDREKFTHKSLFYLWDLISLGYTFLFLAVTDLSVRLEMQTKRFDVVCNLSKDPTFVGKMARIIQYLETTPVDTDKDMLYEKCLAEINKQS